MFLQEGVWGEIGSVPTSSENDCAVFGILENISSHSDIQNDSEETDFLAVLFVLYTCDLIAILNQFRDFGLLQDLYSVRFTFGQIF